MKGLKLLVSKDEKFLIGKDIVVRVVRSRKSPKDGSPQYILAIEAPIDMEIASESNLERFNKILNSEEKEDS